MDFIFPWYLLGAAAIAAPILLHLRRRPPKDHQEFSSLMFLHATPERLTRRSKLEKILLLLLRCLALLLLALFFARPFLRSGDLAAELGAGSRVVALVDRSASMQREGLWEQAVEVVRERVEGLDGDDRLAIALYDEDVELLSAFEEGDGGRLAAQVSGALERLEAEGPGWRGTRLDLALIAAADWLEEASAEGLEAMESEILLVGDFQESAEREALSRYSWPEDITIEPVVLTPEKTGNLGLQLVASLPGEVEGDEAGGGAEAGLQRVRISRSREGTGDKAFQLYWEGDPERAIRGTVPAGGSRVLRAPARDDLQRDAVLVLEGDEHGFDNRAYVARVQPRPLQVLYMAEDPSPSEASSALFYLQRALQPTDLLEPSVSWVSLDEVTQSALDTTDVVVLAGSPEVGKETFLRDFVEKGGLLFRLVEPGADPAALAALLDVEAGGLVLEEAAVDGGYAMLAKLDFESPVLAPFARAKVRDFTKVHIWKHRVLEWQTDAPEGAEGAGSAEEAEGADGAPAAASSPARVLARYDGGAPAWVEFTIGSGRLFLFTSGWDPSESQLVLSSKFVPLLYAMLAEGGFSVTGRPARLVGEPIRLSGAPDAGDWTVEVPGGEEITLEAGAQRFEGTDEPGFYTLRRAAKRVTYGVNLAPAESRVDPFDPELLADFGVTLQGASQVGSRDAASLEEEARSRYREAVAERESRQKLWKWFALGAMLILLMESWLAGRGAGAAAAGPPKEGAAAA